MTEPTDKPFPWFDERLHQLVDAGVRERATGHLLAADGLPLNGPARAARLAAVSDSSASSEAGKTDTGGKTQQASGEPGAGTNTKTEE